MPQRFPIPRWSLALCLVLGACITPAKDAAAPGSATKADPPPSGEAQAPQGSQHPPEKPADETPLEAGDPAHDEVWTLGTVEVDTRDIYSAEDVEDNWIARLLNATHWPTRASVVRREFWIEPGEPIRMADVEELERNLRATGLFAEVRVRLQPRADSEAATPPDAGTDGAGDVDASEVDASDVDASAGPPVETQAAPAGTARVADVRIETEDRLSIGIGASGSFVGSVSSVGTSLSESNLFGTGDRISIGYSENSEDEFRGALSYRDRQFFGSWVTASAQIGRTEEGDFGGLSFERPFKHLADDLSWRVAVGSNETAIDYFDSGETIAEVPMLRESFNAAVTRRFGTPERSWTTGVHVNHDIGDFDAARGPGAASIDVPGDTVATFAGLAAGHRSIFGFREVQGLDTLGYVQDLTLSADLDVLFGPTFRAEEGEEDKVEPTLRVSSHVAFEPLHDTFLSLAARGNGRTEAGELQSWALGFEMTAFELSLRPHTLAAYVAYDEAFEGEGLPFQLTLGEDQGLRGYPSQEFEGERVLKLNFEDRIDLGARIGTAQFGAVVFFDVGWIEDRNVSFGAPLRSVGCGLRIGSDALLGARVVRIDLSFPLDEFEGEEFDPLVSVSIGQVFTFR